MHDRSMQLDQARGAVAHAASRVHELATRVPEPVASVADALRSLTPDQRDAIRANGPAALAAVEEQAAEARARLATLSAQSDQLMREADAAMLRVDVSRFSEISAWFTEHDGEMGQLHALFEELDALRTELEMHEGSALLESR